jgi:hypothetical protein
MIREENTFRKLAKNSVNAGASSWIVTEQNKGKEKIRIEN